MAYTRTTPKSHVSYTELRNYRSNGTISVSGDAWTTRKWSDYVTFGDNIPDWRRRLAKGYSATTSMVGSKSSVQLTEGQLVAQRPKGTGTSIWLTERVGSCGISTALPSGDPSTLSDTEANNAALRKFVSRLEQVNTAFNGGVFLGELTQTLRSIKNPAASLRNLVGNWRRESVALRRRNNFRPIKERKRNFREAIADSWLETQFHWKPLLNDVDDGCRALAELVTGQALKGVRITGTGEARDNASVTTGGGAANLLAHRDQTVVVDHTIVIYRGAVRVNPRHSALMAPRLLGFNPASFVPTAWELVPYSFLIDYFTNIGDILTGWSHSVSELRWCNRTSRKSIITTRSRYTNTAICRAVFPEITTAHGQAKVVCEVTDVSRFDYSGSLTPRFEFEIPGLASKKWLNIAALIAGRDADRRFSFGD